MLLENRRFFFCYRKLIEFLIKTNFKQNTTQDVPEPEDQPCNNAFLQLHLQTFFADFIMPKIHDDNHLTINKELKLLDIFKTILTEQIGRMVFISDQKNS